MHDIDSTMLVSFSLFLSHSVSFLTSQSLAVATLGDKQMAQRIDNLVDEEEFKRFYLQVNFPEC